MRAARPPRIGRQSRSAQSWARTDLPVFCSEWNGQFEHHAKLTIPNYFITFDAQALLLMALSFIAHPTLSRIRRKSSSRITHFCNYSTICVSSIWQKRVVPRLILFATKIAHSEIRQSARSDGRMPALVDVTRRDLGFALCSCRV